MRVTFWGTRGSCPSFPSPGEIRAYAERVSAATIAHVRKCLQSESGLSELRQLMQLSPAEVAHELTSDQPPVFGGETTCVEIQTSEGHVIILDCGSGLRSCAAEILRQRFETGLNEISIFGSHAHLDHRNGLSFAGICFADPPFDIRVFGGSEFLETLDSRFALFSRSAAKATYQDDPVDFAAMNASFQGIELRGAPEGQDLNPDVPWAVRDLAEPVTIGATTIRPFKSYHGATPCLGYRIEHGGKVFVFSTDHEKLSPGTPGLAGLGSGALEKSTRAEQELVELCRGADLAYFDGQYLRAEYLGQQGIGASPAVPRVGWGHGCVEDILDRVGGGEIKHALVGHHDPERSWSSLLEIARKLEEFSNGKPYRVELAQDGQSFEL